MGFTGSEADFASGSRGVCAPCVDDGFYDGKAQLTLESTFVCELETTGHISGQINFNISAFAPEYVPEPSSGASFMDVVVRVETAEFPVKGLPYDVRLADNDGIEEVLRVTSVMRVQEDHQMLRLTTALGTKPKERHVSFARLVSACVPGSDTIVVQADPSDSDFTRHSFSTSGPYSVRVAGRSVRVADATEVNEGMTQQVLVLAERVTFNFGFVTTLSRPARRGDTVVYVRPFEWWYAAATKRREYPRKFPITLRGPEGSAAGIEVSEVSGYSPPDWTCDPRWYSGQDGCDCNCGILDPDCAYPSLQSYKGKVYDSSAACEVDPKNCLECPYCDATGKCSLSLPTGTASFSDEESSFEMVLTLARPLYLAHARGQRVETPIPMPEDKNDAFLEAGDRALDVYSWIEVRRLVDTPEYKPSERYLPHRPELTTSPEALEVEVAMFQVPDSLSFEQVKLCPVLGPDGGRTGISPVFDTDGWGDWKVTRPMRVDNCSLRRVSRAEIAEQCIRVEDHATEQFNARCIRGTAFD